jgi:serine/threonine protein kinase
VYRAIHLASGQTLAVKRLTGNGAMDPNHRRRFEQEARAAMALDHPNVVGVRDLLEHEGELLLTMEYVEGRTLREVMNEERLTPKRALDFARQVADGLTRAHELGIVHRDVKPDNIMVTPHGRAKLLDFGLVKLVEPENIHDAPTRDRCMISQDGLVLGSASYMSPEQIQGSEVDGRSDVFSLGALLYEMLTGSRAFDGASPLEIISAVLWDQPRPLARPKGARATDADELELVVRKSLAKEPNDRYDSMRAFRDEIDRLEQRAAETPHERRRGSSFLSKYMK